MEISKALGGFVKFIKQHAPWLTSSGYNEPQIQDFNCYRGIDTVMTKLKEARIGRRLLSLDGGGTRGFSQVLILEEIANRIMHDLGLQESPPLCNYFDMIGGAGTGGYIAILVGRLGLTAPQLKEEFRQLILRILAGPVTSDELDDFLKSVVKRYTGDSETLMFDPKSSTFHCKTFVGAITVGNVSYITNFRSYNTQDQHINIPIWQATRATLAHPDLFPTTRVGLSDFEQVYVNGEIGRKNPSNEVIREFEIFWPSNNITCLASIGSGRDGLIKIYGDSTSDSVANAMERAATDCDNIAREVAYRFQGRNNYFRLSVEQELQRNLHHQPLTLAEIEAHTRSYLRSPEAYDALNWLVDSLLHSTEVSPWTTTTDHFEAIMDGYISEYSRVVDDIAVAEVQLAAQEAILLLETIRHAKYNEDYWLVFAKIIVGQLHCVNYCIMELRDPLSSNLIWSSISNYFMEMRLVRENLKQLMELKPHRIWGPPTHEAFLSKATINLVERFKRIPTVALNDRYDDKVSAKRDVRFKKFISWISQLDMEKRHQDLRARRASGTGAWLIKTVEFENWLDNQSVEGCRALLGFGDPGAGKTFLCSSIVDHLRNNLIQRRAALAFIYFDLRDNDHHYARNIVGELAKQLLEQAPSVPHEVWPLFQNHTTITAVTAQQIFTLLLRSFGSTYICIDALDECQPCPRHDLLRFISTLKDESIHLFCTARPNVEAQAIHLLEPLRPTAIPLIGNEVDIRRYIDEKIARDPHPTAMDEQLQGEITERLLVASNRSFILAVFQLEFILDRFTKRERRDALACIPTKLFELYDATLGRIRRQSTSKSEMAVSVLTWIYLTHQKLTVSVLQIALAVQPGDTAFDEDGIPSADALIDCCLGLVVIERETSTVCLTHLTLREYFDEHWEELFPLGHSAIASTCLTFLSFEHPDTQSKKLHGTSLFLQYAATFVGDHLRKNSDSQLDYRALELLTNNEKLRLLEQYSSRAHDQKGFSPLHWAAYFGVVSIGTLLLTHGAEDTIDARNEREETPLSVAALRGHSKVVKLLLGTRAVGVNSRDEDKRTPLSFAADNGHEAVVKLLLSTEGVEVDSRDKNRRTPLSYAAGNGCEAVVRLLLGTRGVEVNSKDEDKRTPLSFAAENGHEAVVKILLGTEGAEVDSRSNIGRTPFSLAAQHGYEAVVTLLLGIEQVQVDLKDEDERTPLSYSAEYGHEAVVKLLLGIEQVEVDSRDKDGRTPLSYAAGNGHEAVVRLLLGKNNIRADSRDNSGRTPLSHAAESGSEAVVQLLLGRDEKDINPQDQLEQAPVLWDNQPVDSTAVLQLLSNRPGVNPDTEDSNGRTPLSYAVEYGHVAVAQMLVGHNADVSHEDCVGNTIFSYATTGSSEQFQKSLMHYEKIKQLLLDHGAIGNQASKEFIKLSSAEFRSQDLGK